MYLKIIKIIVILLMILCFISSGIFLVNLFTNFVTIDGIKWYVSYNDWVAILGYFWFMIWGIFFYQISIEYNE